MQSNVTKSCKNDTSSWSPITKEKLMVFIGVIVTMGVVQFPSADDYWSIDPTHTCSIRVQLVLNVGYLLFNIY